MTWWGYVLLGVSAALILVLIFTRKKVVVQGLTDEERQKLLDLDKELLAKDLASEKEAKKLLEDEVEDLKERIRKIEALSGKRVEEIEKEKDSDYKDLIDNPDSADDKLDSILGTSSKEGPGKGS